MTKASASSSTKPPISDEPPGIVRLGVAGLKSIATEQLIDIRPLTILAGANSSGKSSFMQGILLLKQTLEAPYDPGALLISGPNVDFTSAEQMISRRPSGRGGTGALDISFETASGTIAELHFKPGKKRDGGPFDLTSQTITSRAGKYALRSDMESGEIEEFLDRKLFRTRGKFIRRHVEARRGEVYRQRCFLGLAFFDLADLDRYYLLTRMDFDFIGLLHDVIHLPGLRGNPLRDYPSLAVWSGFSGVFQPYTASLVSLWRNRDDERLGQLGSDLGSLGLTWKVEAKSVNGARVELRVSRLSNKPRRGGANDLVNIADVGLGVSQTLPVVVALLAAKPGQMVYIEQPEIHLHPKAQVAMAKLLANAASRGVRVVVETHSSLLLTGVQTLVASGDLDPKKVVLHWFQRNDEGQTAITSSDVDEAGRFGDWPVDFADVAMDVESQYLDAAERVLYGRDAGR